MVDVISFDFDQYFVCFWVWYYDFFDDQWFVEFMDDGGFYGFVYVCFFVVCLQIGWCWFYVCVLILINLLEEVEFFW